MVQPPEPTHEQGGKWTKLSYFLVHPGMASMMQSCAVGHSPLKGGHRAVVIKLLGHTPKFMEKVLKRREKLPMREPIVRRLPPPEWPEVPGRFRSQEEATATWKQLVTCVEHELLVAHGILGEEAKTYQGRAKGPIWQVRPCRVVQGPEKAGHNPECRAWRWLAKTSGELLRLYRCIGYAAEKGPKRNQGVRRNRLRGSGEL